MAKSEESFKSTKLDTYKLGQAIKTAKSKEETDITNKSWQATNFKQVLPTAFERICVQMRDRTATDTIKGYFYQFDYSILAILKLINPEDTIIVEGVEDVDISSIEEEKAIQCKYYSKTSYNHAEIKKPIQLMLENFKDNKDNGLKYHIYGTYKDGQDKLPDTISLQFLKDKFLTYKRKNVTHEVHAELHLSDEDLELFLEHLVIDINAPDFEMQNTEVLREIMRTLSCSENDAEFFYNNALYEVRNLAIQSEKSMREISKSTFIQKINNKEQLFNQWYLQSKSRKEFFKLMKVTYFSSFNLSPFSRFILIDLTQNTNEIDIKTILIHISKKLSKITRREASPFCPFVYLSGIDDDKLVRVKQMLRNDSINFVDGYNFKGANFDEISMCVEPNFINKICLKIINEINELDLILENLQGTRQIYQFYLEKLFYENDKHEHIKIPIQQISDIKEII